MKFNHTEHILVETLNEKFIRVSIDDLELFDFIEDYLKEKFDFDNCLYKQSETKSGVELHNLLIPKEYSFEEVCSALSEIEIDEIQRIYALNNS